MLALRVLLVSVHIVRTSPSLKDPRVCERAIVMLLYDVYVLRLRVSRCED